LASRRSRREFAAQPLPLQTLSQILWAAQGITEPAKGYRTAPSARAIYPLNLYAVVRKVAGLQPGLYHYVPDGHKLGPLMIEKGLLTDKSQQASVRNAPVVLVYGAIYPKAQAKFPGEAGVKVTLQESGHIAQNVYLQAESLDLATVVVGGFDPGAVKKALNLPAEETIVYLQPLGLRPD
jgi:SagB-type dehydrogenase family enzyme